MKQEKKAFSFEIKSADSDSSEFEGFSAAIGNEDLHRDIIEPGAFAKTIQERVASGSIKLLDNHQLKSTNDVIGKVIDAEERVMDAATEGGPTHKLWTLFKVASDDNSQTILQKVKDGILNSLSIGYCPIKVEYEKDEDSQEEDPVWAWRLGEGTRIIKELAWWETSIVIWPANEEATIIDGSLKTINHFSELCKHENRQIPPRYVEAAVKALNNLIEIDINPEQVQNVKNTLTLFENRTQRLNNIEKDIFEQLVAEYKGKHEAPTREHFFVWFTNSINSKESLTFDSNEDEQEVVPNDTTETDNVSEEIDVETSSEDSNENVEETPEINLESLAETLNDAVSLLQQLAAQDNSTENNDEHENNDENEESAVNSEVSAEKSDTDSNVEASDEAAKLRRLKLELQKTHLQTLNT